MIGAPLLLSFCPPIRLSIHNKTVADDENVNINDPRHVPAMGAEVLRWLAPPPGARAADATGGAGGHASMIAAAIGGAGRLLILDRDRLAIEICAARFANDPRVRVRRRRFSQFAEALGEAAEFFADPAPRLDCVLFDLGFSSMQVDDPARGFSFLREGPLDLRMEPESGAPSAAELIQRLPEREIADILYQFGEERASRRIARAIVEARSRRKIVTTTDLAEIVRRAAPGSRADAGRIHPATRTFQALRIRVNDELGELRAGLEQALERLAPGGRLAVLSYHSLEDRIVKQTFRGADPAAFAILTKKPLAASEAEVLANPRARSAKLRAIERRRGGA